MILQAHLKAALADAQPRLLKELTNRQSSYYNKLTGLFNKTKN
jgi:hypothetical protein